MDKELPTLRLVKSCSTCKFAKWGDSNFNMGGKKQGGICLLGCDGLSPKKPEEYPDYAFLVGVENRDEYDIRPSFTDRRKKLVARDKFEKYINKHIDSPESIKNIADLNLSRDEVVTYWMKYYDSVATSKYWWIDNYPKVRLVHRQTVCSAWSQGPKSRESYAKQIVEGKETLNNK